MTVEIVTPDAKVFEGEAQGVRVPGHNGSFEVLDRHAAIVSTLVDGPLRVKTAKGEQKFVIEGGLLEMSDNKLVVLAEAVKP